MQITAKRDASALLAENVVNTGYKGLSPNDIEVVKKDILDTLGCIIGGSSHPPFKQLVAYLKDQRGKRESTIMVFGGRVPAQAAVLANAGILDGKRATGYPGVLDKMHLPRVELTQLPVVSDGKVITSRGPGTAMDFALELIEKLAGPEKRRQVEEPLVRP